MASLLSLIRVIRAVYLRLYSGSTQPVQDRMSRHVGGNPVDLGTISYPYDLVIYGQNFPLSPVLNVASPGDPQLLGKNLLHVHVAVVEVDLLRRLVPADQVIGLVPQYLTREHQRLYSLFVPLSLSDPCIGNFQDFFFLLAYL